ACDNNSKPSLVTDAEINSDVAASAGDAMSLAVANMIANESAANMPGSAPPTGANFSDGSITYTRSRVCYDATFTVVTNCTPVSVVRTVVTSAQLDGTRSFANEDESKTSTGSVRRTSRDSLTRVFTSGTETQRVHNDRATANDSLTVTGEGKSKFIAEIAVDSVKAVT